jgi:hypothetical protein
MKNRKEETQLLMGEIREIQLEPDFWCVTPGPFLVEVSGSGEIGLMDGWDAGFA